jgi:hypothetical protein
MIVYNDEYGSDKFGLYLGSKDGKIVILTRKTPKDDEFERQELPVGNVHHYAEIEPIAQNFKPNQSNLAEDDLLETYVINGV